MKAAFLGIDTSCYTTSCALVDESGALLGEERKLLTVKPGRRGLQQSEMVFQHTRALPQLIEQLPAQYTLCGIGVSAFPRREENSYMPAFLVGRGLAQSMAHMMQVPLYEFSHQENHILAACREMGHIINEPFYSLHVSGGTTELMYCVPNSKGLFHTELAAGSIDLHGGQFVDRMGVALGLPFPAGPHLERAARELFPDAKAYAYAGEGLDGKPIASNTATLATQSMGGTVDEVKGEFIEATMGKTLADDAISSRSFRSLPIAVKQGQMSFGGPCSEAQRRLARGEYTTATMGMAVFQCISLSMVRFLRFYQKQRPAKHLIAVGGVMCNYYLRQALEDYGLKHRINIHFASPLYSSDNATGVAYGASILQALAKV